MAPKQIKIVSRWDESKVLYVAKGAADVRAAVEAAAASGAYLRGANLGGANLRGAYLRDAIGLNPYLIKDLLMMKDQVGKIRAYKLVRADGLGPQYPTIKYEVKGDYEVANANCDDEVECGAGINLATLSWCMKEWQKGMRILLAEFKASDIAAIPNGDGKFRVFRCHIVREVDLEEIGVVQAAEK